MAKRINWIGLGNFGSNFIGEPLFYQSNSSDGDLYKSKIIDIFEYDSLPYIITDLDIELSSYSDESGVRGIRDNISFWACMCYQVRATLYNMIRFRNNADIWGLVDLA